MENIATKEDFAPLFDPDTLLAFLRDCDVSHEVHHHVAVFTVAESEHISAAIAGAHTRNLFLKDKKDRMFLVTLRHETRVDLKKLEAVIGASRISFGSPERLWANLGVRPGSVTPFAILNDTERKVTLVLEEGMMAEEIVNYHPLVNTMTVSLTPQGLMTILAKQGITPHIIDLSAAAPDAAA